MGKFKCYGCTVCASKSKFLASECLLPMVLKLLCRWGPLSSKKKTVYGDSILSEAVVVIHLTVRRYVPGERSPSVSVWCTDTLLQMHRSVVSLGNAVWNGSFVIMTLNEYEQLMIRIVGRNFNLSQCQFMPHKSKMFFCGARRDT